MSEPGYDLPWRDVVVIASDPGNDAVRRRITTLEYLRLRHLFETGITVEEKGTGRRLRYRITAEWLRPGRQPERTLRTLMSANVIVALVDSTNVAVISELSMRAVLRGEWIIVGRDSAESLLPTVFREGYYIRGDEGDSRRVAEWIALDSKSEGVTSATQSLTIPAELSALIDTCDKRLLSLLQEALHSIEHYGAPCSLASLYPEYVSPWVLGRALNVWSTPLPFSIWRVRWNAKPRGHVYTTELMIGPPTLMAGNRLFASMFTMQNFPEFPPDPDGPDALTLPAALAALQCHMEPQDFEAFVRDQDRLSGRLFMTNEFATAQVPIRLTPEHPDPDFRGKSLMPNVFARCSLGLETESHATYLFVIYTEVL